MQSSTSRRSARERAAYRCSECAWQTSRWVGRCPQCQSWGSLAAAPVEGRGELGTRAAARSLPRIELPSAALNSTGVDELDRVLGGGLTPGSVVLVAGEPGIGKSTLLLDVAARHARADRRSLVITGEESVVQVRARAERIGAVDDHVFLAAETDLDAVVAQVDVVRPGLMILDSVQTIASAQVDGVAGGVAQVRAVAAALTRVAKEYEVTVLLVGHVTKDGAVAGPRLLEHVVDVVLSFEGDRHSRLRLLRTVKNRFGPADEVGCFDLSDAGIRGVADPSSLFVTSAATRADPVPGTCVTATMEGRRALVAEVQGLVTEASLTAPRRATSGLDAARLAMVLAVLEKRARLPVLGCDVHASTVGGIRLVEPAIDLPLALALASSVLDQTLPPGTIAIGEVGLAGELRPVNGLRYRLAEAARLGFRQAIVPAGGEAVSTSLRLRPVADLQSALRVLTVGRATLT